MLIIENSKSKKLKFEEYLNNLTHIEQFINTKQRLIKILDGEPSQIFRDSFPLDYRREQGTFFSSHRLSRILFKMAEKHISSNSKIVDPTCGIGDLLIPFAYKLSINKSFGEILNTFNSRIIGYDINPMLIKATKIRLYLLSKLISGQHNLDGSSLEMKDFNNIEIKNFDDFNIDLDPKDLIVFNPPFGAILAPENNIWGKGKIQTAAFFTSNLLDKIPEGTNVFAILPDVLRSGTRYNNWREKISQRADVLNIKKYGRFDKYTDVDVFLVHFQKKKSTNVSVVKWTPTTKKEKINKYFDICVGSVVPFRLNGEGKSFIYINTNNALPWKGLKCLTRKIRFDGKSHRAPFIVIRRTSSPNDKNRAVPTLINEKGNFVIENHLFVLTPKDGSVKTCRLLIKNLKNKKTNKWLNEYIRCRHLTKESLMELPWWTNE